ncbi:MAG: 2Fe-2S iron-sulfur cluster-binding protein [Candidatus Edwardsbacteria bacterium]
MPNIRINGIDFEAEKGQTILEVARFLGIKIPTLCYNEGLTPYGACRLCLVEIGEGEDSKLVSSCTYPVEEGLKVRTHSKQVIRSRKMMIELLLSVCPTSKTIQDLASSLGVRRTRFKVRNEDCILCGLCVRMCAEQMDARAIGFVNRGYKQKISTPFDIKSEVCRTCGACMYICPACQMRCLGPQLEGDVCGSCLELQPSCLEFYEDLQCWMGTVDRCGTCVKEKKEVGNKVKK